MFSRNRPMCSPKDRRYDRDLIPNAKCGNYGNFEFLDPPVTAFHLPSLLC